MGRSRAVSFDQRLARYDQAPSTTMTRKRSTSEYQYNTMPEGKTELPFSNIFDTYFDEGLSDTLVTSRESLSVPVHISHPVWL